MNRRSFLAASVSGLGVLAADVSPVVSTQSGKVRGRNTGGVYSFRGIPYGAPTGRENRFRAPKPPSPWAGVRDALDWGHCAPQSNRARGAKQHDFFAALEPDPSVTASEDCLNLNVWTAGLDRNRKRPVMVWIHGGGYDQWSANASAYDGESLARHHDVVVVTVNHRLGVLGYLWVERSPANLGQLDLVAALQWVRDNITAFGGDPQRVMVFGQSGGGRKISMLLAMPAAKGLFHAAAIESGATLTAISPATAERTTRTFLDRIPGSKLRTVPFEQLITASSGLSLGPVVDGETLPANPFDPVASPYSANVPVIVGYTRTERTVYEIDDPSYGTLDDAGLRSRTRALLGDATDHVIEAYRRKYPKASPYALAMNIATDVAAIPSIRLAERHAPTYLYIFAWETPVMALRSPHTLEVPFVFHNVERCANMTGPITQPIRMLEAACAAAWTALARTGTPNHGGLPTWPAYSVNRRATMSLDVRSRVEIDPIREVREALQAV